MNYLITVTELTRTSSETVVTADSVRGAEEKFLRGEHPPCEDVREKIMDSDYSISALSALVPK